MGSIFQSLLSLVKEGRDALLAPAEDPRDRYGTNYSNPDGPKGRKATLEERREYLETGFSAMNSETGSMALEELAHEYAQLQPVLQRRKETDPLAVVHLPGLVEEAYQQGLSILEDAMELGRAVTLRDRDKLECDVVRLQGEIETLSKDGTQGTTVRMREERLASHQELLSMIKQEQLRVDELLHQCDGCRASLHRTRIELAALRADASERSVSTVTESLRKTISQAQGVQEELKRLGF